MASDMPIVIVGAGIMGLMAGWTLIGRGHKVRIFEAGQIGDGASGGQLGALAPHAPETWNGKKQFQLESLIAAGPLWDEIAQVSGRDPGYARHGRIQPVEPGGMDRAEARVAGAARFWPAPYRMALTRQPEGALVPQSETGWWLVDTLSARLAPRQALAALAGAIRARGGEIIENTPIRPDAPPEGRAVIWAHGVAGLDDLSTDLGRAAGGPVKGQSALLGFAAPDSPQAYAGGLHLVPHADGSVAVGSTSERDRRDTQTDAQLDAVIDAARTACPVLADAPVLARWAGLRPRARSRAPMIGLWPGRSGQVVMNGGFKIGFGMAPAMARAAAALALGERCELPEGFAPPAPV